MTYRPQLVNDQRYEVTQQTTKRIGVPLGSDNNGTNNAIVDWNTRCAIRTPSATTRWRLRIGNTAYASAAASPRAGALTLTGAYVGALSLASDGTWAGAMAAAATSALGSYSSASDGTEVVTAWVTDPTLQFGPDGYKALSYGMTCGAGQVLSKSSGVTGVTCYGTNMASHAGDAAVPGVPMNSVQLADVRLEYECVDNLPVVLIMGDSTASGYVDDGALVPAIPSPMATWPWQSSARNHFHVINAGVNGSACATDYLSKWCLQRFDLATSVPDAYVDQFGINDANNGVSLATFLTNTIGLRTALVAAGIKHSFKASVMLQPRWKPGVLLTDAAVSATSIRTSAAYASADVIGLGYLTANNETVTASGASTVNTAGGYDTPVGALTKTHVRGDSTGLAAESLRLAYNRAIGNLYGGFEGVFDFADLCKPGDSATLAALFGTGTIHPGSRMYALMGEKVRITRNYLS